MAYVKLHDELLTSSIWCEPAHTKLVWITLLVKANWDGEVQASIPGLAKLAGVSLQEAQDALGTLLSPDPYSRTPEHEGRRLEPIRGGWRILNYAFYRYKSSLEEKREKERSRKSSYRDRLSRGVAGQDGTCPTEGTFCPSIQITDTDQREERETRARTAPQSTHFVGNGGQHYGRIFLHHWQLEALMATLGAEAEDFALDAWLDQLSHKADERRLVLDRRVMWPWVQGELREECERRGLAMAEPAIEPAARRRGKTPMPDRSAAFGASGPSEWRCTHEPPCHSRMSCATVTARKCPHGPPCDDGGMCISRILEGDLGTAAEGVA